MLENPVLKYCYRAEFFDDDSVLLLSEKDNAILTGKMYRHLLPEIQHQGIPPGKLVEKLSGKLLPVEVYYALEDLERNGYITEAAPTLPREVCAYWNTRGIDIHSLLEVLREKQVSIEFIGLQAYEVFREAFDKIGINTGENIALRAFITDDYQRQEFREINRQALGKKQPWMLIKPVGVELWIGPVFLPGKTACWECLKQRLEINRPLDDYYKTQKKSESIPHIPAGSLPLTLQAAANLTALEIAQWLYAGKNDRLDGSMLSFDTQNFETQSHLLVKRPQCKACGEFPYKPKAGPILLERKTQPCETAAGGYREVTPEETLEKYQHNVSPITGIMPFLKPYHAVQGTNVPVYNYTSGRNTAMRSKTLFWLNQHLRSGNGGKGRSWAQAKTGALCEAIERYCLTYHGDEPSINSSLRELGDSGIHPNDCMNYSEAQYRDREAINQTYTKFYNLVPVPFDESLEMEWSPVYSLTGETFKYLPSCFCYAQYPAEDETRLFSYPDCNGSAAGNSIEEAILQGFLELVERDSAALWWYNRLRKPAVDLLNFKDPYFYRLMEYYKSINRGLYVLDLTADLQIPAFAAVSNRLEGKPDIVFGFGAHVDAKIGVERALIELNQMLPVVDVPKSDREKGNYRNRDRDFLHWLETATLENQPYLVPLEKSAEKKTFDYPRLCEANIYDSVLFCINSAAEQGLETLVLDLTRPDIGLPVVKVVVPGLRHFWKRLAPGRLYDVPVKMGWLEAHRAEDELNPVAIFI